VIEAMLAKLSNQRAYKELDRYAPIALACSVASFIMFWWLSIVGMCLGVRAALLSYHYGNSKRPDLTRRRIMAGAAFSIGMIGFLTFLINQMLY